MQKKQYTYDYPRPMLTADCVVVNPKREVMLVKRGNEPFRGHWALPGGFMEMDETLEHCAIRELQEETGLVADEKGLRLVGVFSGVERDPRGRTVTAAYLWMVGDSECPKAGDDAVEVHWWPLEGLPALAFDHDLVLKSSIDMINSML